MQDQGQLALASEDLWQNILVHLNVQDILCLALTCTTLSHLLASKKVWLSILHREVLSPNILVPTSCKNIEDLDGLQVKAFVVHALRLHKHITRGCAPAVVVPLHQHRSVTWVKIIQGRWLLAASQDSSCSVLSLWSIESLMAPKPSAVIAEAFLDAPVSHGIVDVQDTQVVIALELRGEMYMSCIDIITLRCVHNTVKFVKLGRVHGASRLRTLHGDLVGYAVHEERSVASKANWKTGTVHHLFPAPEMTGGCLGMALDGNIAVTVTPAHVQVFDLTFSENGNVHHSELKRTLPIQHSVGFVDVAFRVPDAFTSAAKSSPSLHLFISGENGLFAFVIPKANLLLEGMGLDLFLVWHISAVEPPPGQIPERDRAALEAALFEPYPYMDYSEPQFGRDCTTVSWIEGPCVVASTEYPINLVMLTSRLLQRGTPPATDAYYRIDGMKEVAFYAMAVRDYDNGLGLLAIGNAFGELALYSLLPSEDLAAVYDALEDVPIPAYMPQEDTLPTTAPMWSSPVSNAYLSRPTSKCAPLEKWRIHQPTAMPKGWTSMWDASDWIWPQFLEHVWSFTWSVEHGYHYLGTAIPLVSLHDFVVFKCGGLFFLWDAEDDDLLLFDPALGLEEILSRLGPDDMMVRAQLPPTTKVRCENTAHKPPGRFTGLWRWERRDFGKDRWQEFEARGGNMGGAWWKGIDISPPGLQIHM